jgi:hypothetical protein
MKVGIEFKVTLHAKWELGFNFKVAFKNAVLDFTAGANTKVTVSGSIGVDVGIGEVGGKADGVLLDT